VRGGCEREVPGDKCDEKKDVTSAGKLKKGKEDRFVSWAIVR